MKRRAAVEPVIGHAKAEHRMDRNYLTGRDGDRINAVAATATASMPSSPPPATTSACSCAGSQSFCASSLRCSPFHLRRGKSLKSAAGRVLHGRLTEVRALLKVGPSQLRA
jgi:hypothetical protein